MHKFNKSTITFDTLRNGEFILSSGKSFHPNFSQTDAPENWWRTSQFATTERFGSVDKDKFRFPRVGQYKDPDSTVTLGSVSLTRKSFLDRRPRVTAPATGATAEARLWGQDKWLEEPDPGPGHYTFETTCLDAGGKGCTSYFMRSKQPRFEGDRPVGFLKVKHKQPPSASPKKHAFDLGASLARGTKYKARMPGSRRSRRPRPRTTGGVTFADEAEFRPRTPPESGAVAGFGGTARPRSSSGRGGSAGGILRNSTAMSGSRSRSLWSPAPDDQSESSWAAEEARTLTRSVSRLASRSALGGKTPTPAERRAAFESEEELRGVEDLDVFSLRMEGKHHQVKLMMEERKKRDQARKAKQRARTGRR